MPNEHHELGRKGLQTHTPHSQLNPQLQEVAVRYVVVRESAPPVFQAARALVGLRHGQALLNGRDAFLHVDLGFDIVDRVGGIHGQRECAPAVCNAHGQRPVEQRKKIPTSPTAVLSVSGLLDCGQE